MVADVARLQGFLPHEREDNLGEGRFKKILVDHYWDASLTPPRFLFR